MSIPTSALVVDDEAHVRMFIKLILKELGVQNIREAKNGLEALEAYRSQPSDCVLMDVNMAGMDGLEALEIFSKEFPKAIIIMITSSATREVVEKCIERGARNYIRKDTPKQEIANILKSTFEEES